MLLYHGSNMVVENPRLIGQTRGLDFGSGFYLATDAAQAARFSETVVKRRKTGIVSVSVFDFDMENAKRELSIRTFESANTEWLWFVIENRLKIYSGEHFDIVIGAVANDSVMPSIQAFMGGFINEEAVFVSLKTSNLVDQICLKTEKALSMLKFFESKETKGGRIYG